MERKTIRHIIQAGDIEHEVTIRYVYNYIHELYSDSLATVSDVTELAKETADIERERHLLISEAGLLIAERDKKARERINEIRKETKGMKTEIKALKKEIREKDKELRLHGLFPMIKGVLEDNGETNPDLLSFEYWDKKVDHGEAWRFIVTVITKDAENSKKKEKK